MKPPRQKRDETSAAITPTLGLIVICSGLFVLTAYASDPSWWSSTGTGTQSAVIYPPQVVTNTTTGAVTTNYVRNDYAVVTQGQLKHFTARAVDALNAGLSGGAGTNLNNMVSNWAQDYLTNGYATNTANPTRPYKPSDLQAENVGQLKYIGNLVWGQLVAAGNTNAVPSWLAENTNSDNAVANLGQLKELFNFNPYLPVIPSNVTVYQTGTQATVSWSDATGSLTGYTLQESTDGGTTWTNAANFLGTTTMATITGLQSGTTYSFRVIATNSSGNSCPSATATVTTTAPSVEITASINSPSNGNASTIYAGNSFQFTVIASTTVGTIQRVDFYSDSVYLGSATSFPWTMSVPYLPAGEHQLEAVVQNSAGDAVLLTCPITSVSAMDTNGLPIAWELQYFNQIGLNPSSSPDGNGFTLLQDYEGGADPTDYYSQPGPVAITPTLTIVQGNNQTAWTGRYLDESLQVQVTQNGTPLVNAPVQFSVGSGSGILATDLSQPMGPTEQVLTDSSGDATIYYYQSSALAGSTTVAATAGPPGQTASATFSLSAPASGATPPGGNGSPPPGTPPPPPTNPPPPSDGSIQLYAETQVKTHDKVGFDPFTNNTTPPSKYLTEYLWDERSGPVPQVSASETKIWNPETETETNILSGTVVPDMYVDVTSGPLNTTITPTFLSYEGIYGNSTDSCSYTLTNQYTTPALIQLTINDVPPFTGNETTASQSASYELSTNELTFALQKMQYRILSNSTAVTPINWLIVFQPDSSSADQTVRTKAMSWTGAPTNFPPTTLDPTTQTFDNGSPTNRNGTYIAVPDNITRDGQMINTTNNTVWVGQQICLTNMVMGSPTNSIVTSYQWHIPGVTGSTNDTAFYDYEPTKYNSNYTNLITPTNYTTNSYINFYWCGDATNLPVSCTQVIYGQTNTITAALNVQKPSAVISALHGIIAVDAGNWQSGDSSTALHFGSTLTGATPGMAFGVNASVFPAGSNSTNNLIWNQMINSNYTRLTTATGTLTLTNSGGYDSGNPPNDSYPYNNGNEADDSPGRASLQTNYTSCTKSFSATMYFMWQPSTNMVGGDKTVPVALRCWPWQWSATATNGAPSAGWGLESSNYPSVTVPDVDVTSPPIWTNESPSAWQHSGSL